jgi:hypothetical protein
MVKKEIDCYQISIRDEVSNTTENYLIKQGFEVAGTGLGSVEFCNKNLIKFKEGWYYLYKHKIPFVADIIYTDGSNKIIKNMREINKLKEAQNESRKLVKV